MRLLLAQLTERDAVLSVKDARPANRDQELKAEQLKIDQFTHEMAILKALEVRLTQQTVEKHSGFQTKAATILAIVAPDGTTTPHN
jgi:hypothetical protein